MSTSNYLKKLEELKKKAGIQGTSNSSNNSASTDNNTDEDSQSVLERIKARANGTYKSPNTSSVNKPSSSLDMKGWEKYLQDEEAKKNAPKYDLNKDGKDSWWEKVLGRLGQGNVDTSLPMAGYTQVLQDIERDESYRRPSNDWTEEQKAKFGEYYLNSPESAYMYAEETNKQNNKRKEEAKIQEIKDKATSGVGSGILNTVGAIASAPLALADYLQDAAYANAGREIGPDGLVSPFEYSQAVTGGISEHLNETGGTLPDDWWIIGGKGWGDVYGLGTSIAQSMASGYLLGPAGTLVSYFGQGAAAGVDDAIARGASNEQAILYGAALGAFEGVAEMIGIDNLFKLGSSSTVKGLIKNVLKQAGAEGGEELFTAVTSEIADRWIMADKSNFNILVEELMAQGMSEADAKKKAWMSTIGDIAYDTIAGAVSGSVSGGIHSGVQTAITNADAKKNFGGQTEALLIEAGTTEGTDKAVDKYINKYGEKGELSGWNISHLLEITDNQKVKSAVEGQLTKLGESGDVSALAEVITKKAQGIELSKKEQALIDGSKFGQRVVNTLDRENIKSGEYDTGWTKGIGTRRLNSDVYNKSLYDYVAEAKEEADRASLELAEMDSVTENATSEEGAVESEISAPVEGVKSVAKAKMTDAEGNETPAKVAKIAAVENGEATLELEGGETVKASEVDFGDSGIGFVYNAAVEMVSGVGGFNVDAANLMVKGVNPGISTKAADLYVAGFNEAYRYGAMGYPVSELAKGGVTSKIGVKQRELAYNLGRAFGEGKVAEKQAKIDSIVSKKAENISKTDSKEKKGKVHLDVSMSGKNLTKRQQASIDGLKVVAEAMGVDIRIFESTIGKDGKRQGANGWYDPATKEIHLDLYAGADGNGIMLFTASHELTHHIKEVAPAKFKVFADALLEEYSRKGVSLDELISRKLETLEANGRLEGKSKEQAYDLAYEEVVADAAESMLVDSNAIEALSKKINAQDKSLWETIKNYIIKLIKRIKAAYEGLDPDSREGKLVREMADSAERLQKLWVDALLSASEVSTEQTLGESGIIVNSKTESASLMSVRDVLTDAERKKVSKALAERFGVTQSEANEWLTAETSLASLILNPKYSQYLDYTADPNEEAIKSNSDYPQGTVDFSNICKKRRDFTEVMNRVLRNFPNHIFAATDLAKIRTIMEEEGMEVACAICYVEDRRQLDSVVAQDFIDSLAIYREGGKIRPDGKPFNANQLKAFKLIEGDTYTPSIYELISLEGRNALKSKNPAMEEAWVKFNNARGMQSVRLLLNDAEYKRQILKYTPAVVKRKNDLGGLRIYSFSDMEMFHLIDIIQVITDSATVGLSLQGYTKVNEYARAVKDTGEKLNRSLIPKGELGYHMENGRVVLDFDTVEGIDINHPDFFDNIDNPNVGNIVIGINATQIKAAMTSKFIDQIIPFHTGQSGEVLGEKGIATWDNYKDFQSERDAKTKKKSAHQINIYTEVINAAEAEGHPITNKVEFVNKFLEVCKENNLIPRFSDFLNVDENGDYVYTEGYHKFLVDFKTFDQNTGEYLPQMPVKPIFDNEYITKLLTDYVKSQKAKDAEVAKAMPKVLDRITKEIVKPSEAKYSDRASYAPTFYSHMGKVIDDVKIEKMGTSSILNHLKNRGVKDEEIKWSGIEAFLEGKKSVTKAELQEFVAGSQLQIEEEMSGRDIELRYDHSTDSYTVYDGSGDVIDTYTYDAERGGYSSENDDEVYEYASDIEKEMRWVHGTENAPRHSQYKLEGGTNYRELVFKMPNSTYSNNAMRGHWGDDAEGILAHTRIQDFDVDGKKMLFIEELQSDWHNEGLQTGYVDNQSEAEIDRLQSVVDEKFFAVEDYSVAATGLAGEWETIEKTPRGVKLIREYREARDTLDKAMNELEKKIPDAPFRDNYHEYVLKRLLRMAAEEGYDSIGWTTADIQSERWSEDYAEGYRIEYDQDIPKFLRKYGKKWGTSVGKTSIDGDTDVWSMDIPDSMKDSVLYEGQALYQDRNPDTYSNRSLLAGALETAVQNDIEREKLKQYKQKIDLINAEEQKLHDLREQIKELSFKKGPRDTEAIKKLQFEANQAANRINTYDKQLLNLESTKALKGVLEREKALARKRDAQKYKEALERYREKSAKTQRELMDRYQESRKRGVESRNKTAMRHKIKDVVNELNQYLLKGTKDKHVPIELQKAVAEALDAVNMDTVGAGERIAKKQAEMRVAKSLEEMQRLSKEIEHIQEMGGNMEAKISRLKTAYDSIINSDDPLVANSHDDVISSTIGNVMEYVGETPLRDMSLPQLEAVYDMYRMVLHSIRNANKAFKAKKSEEISVIANRVLEEIDKLGKKKALQTKAGQTVSEFDWNNQKPVYAFERIGSDSFTEVFNNVRAGEDAWAVDMTEAQEFLENQKQNHKYDSWDFDKKYGFTSSTGKSFELSLGQIMSLYAYSKRGDQAIDHLRNGGFVFDGLTEVKEKNKLGVTKTYQLKDATAYNLSDETLLDILSKLTPEQKAFADAMQDYLSTVMGEKGNEVSLELYGVKLFKEKNYFPLKSAPQFLERAREQAMGDVKIKNKGFTKETTPKAKNPIVLTSFMDVWAGHVNEMSMYHSFTLALEDFYRVYNYKTPASETMDSESVISFLENAHGDASVSYIDQLLKDLNGGARSDPRESAAKALMSKFKKASVMASLSVVVQQPSAIIRAQALVDAKYFVGKKVTQGKHKETWAEVKKYAPVAAIKEMGYFDVGMGQSSTEWLKGEKSLMDKVDDALSKAPALADELTWVSIWNAVKRETAHNNPTMKTGSEEFLKLAGERFTEVIVKTQVYDSTLARSANMRSKSAFMSMWTAFMAEPTTSINMLQDAFKKGNKKIARTMGAVYGSVILNSALVSLVYALRDDDEDETFLEKYLSRFTTEVIDGINPLTYIPFVKDIWSALQGFDIERSDMTLITRVIDSLQQLVKVAAKDTSDMDDAELKEHRKAVSEAILSITDNLASLTGVPVKNIRRDINGIINGFKTIKADIDGRETTAGSLGDNIREDVKDSVPVWGWFPDEKKGDKLYDAIIKGDKAYEERLKSGYTSESSYNSAIRKALRENDPRIKEAAVARNKGDIAEYMKIAKEIIREGHFKQDDVVAAINSEISAMNKGETSSTPSDKVVSLYKIEDYYAALEGGTSSVANTVKEDLIATEVANGKDRDEAESSFYSKFVNHIRDMYEDGDVTDYKAKEMLVSYGDKSADEAASKVQYWSFKMQYPDYDLSESAVSKYYSDVKPSGISVDVYYDYSKQRSKAEGVDLNGDGKTDSGSVKREVMEIINSLPISSYQKDTLYFLNGWSQSTLWEAPWR